MKAEYVTSTIGKGTELHISAAEYKRINSEEGWSDNPNLKPTITMWRSKRCCRFGIFC